MKCPDCKKGKLEIQLGICNKDNDGTYEIAEPYYKCDACKTEYQPEDVEE